MLCTLTPQEMRRVEARVIKETAVTGEQLMQRAAAHVAAAVGRSLPQKEGTVLAISGTGNNGGDAMAALRLLSVADPSLSAVLWLLQGELSSDAARELARLQTEAPQVNILRLCEESALGGPDFPQDLLCVIDGLFGTGLSRAVTGVARRLCLAMAEACEKGVAVIAVDIPSGLHGETGHVLGAAVRATETVTFHRPKTGLYVGEGPNHTGRVSVVDIGIPSDDDDAAGFFVAEPTDIPAFFPPRRPVSHKGSYGRVLLWAGRFGMAGAAAICATAALRTGAGLVTVACPEAIVPTIQQLCPCATCLPLPPDPQSAWELLSPALLQADAVAMGCGLGTDAYAQALILRAQECLVQAEKPAVWDADALNLLALNPDIRPRFTHRQILTPHPAEAARLLGIPTASVLANAPQAARQLRARYGASIVLKGASSILLSGEQEGLNVLGTPAMAKGGSGDALTGVLAALLAGAATGSLPLSPFSILQAGCGLHGLAGLQAETKYGQRGVLATDLCDFLGLSYPS